MTDSMEIYWGADCQIQVTPVASQEVCVALISRDRTRGWTMCCAVFRNSQIIWTKMLRARSTPSQVKGFVFLSNKPLPSPRRLKQEIFAGIRMSTGAYGGVPSSWQI